MSSTEVHLRTHTHLTVRSVYLLGVVSVSPHWEYPSSSVKFIHVLTWPPIVPGVVFLGKYEAWNRTFVTPDCCCPQCPKSDLRHVLPPEFSDLHPFDPSSTIKSTLYYFRTRFCHRKPPFLSLIYPLCNHGCSYPESLSDLETSPSPVSMELFLLPQSDRTPRSKLH